MIIVTISVIITTMIILILTFSIIIKTIIDILQNRGWAKRMVNLAV